jgi:hypothetical protein
MADQLPVPSDMPVAKYADDKSFDIVASGSGFLPRVQLFGGSSGPCKEGKIGIGRFGLVPNKDTIHDLTQQFDCLVIAWRPKAMRIGGGTVHVVYNPQSEDFKKIQNEADVQDSGCMFGPEFLLVINGKFCTLFMSSKTMRREAPNLRTLVGGAATIAARLIKTQRYTWHGPAVSKCSTPLTNLPTVEEIKEQAQKFGNPPEQDVEAADAEDRTR